MRTSRRLAEIGFRGVFVVLAASWCAGALYLLALAGSRMVEGDVTASLVGLMLGLLVLAPGLLLVARVGATVGVLRWPPVTRPDADPEYRYPLGEGVAGPGW